DNQPDNSTASSKYIATNTYLLVVWDVNDYGFYACLVNCAEDLTKDEDKLWALHYEYRHQFYELCDTNIITWLIHLGTAMKMRHDITYGSDYKLNIILSEGAGRYNMKEPMDI